MVILFGAFIGSFMGFGAGIIISLAPVIYVLMVGKVEAGEVFSMRTAVYVMCASAMLLMAVSFYGTIGAAGNLLIMLFTGCGIYAAFMIIASFRATDREGK